MIALQNVQLLALFFRVAPGYDKRKEEEKQALEKDSAGTPAGANVALEKQELISSTLNINQMIVEVVKLISPASEEPTEAEKPLVTVR